MRTSLLCLVIVLSFGGLRTGYAGEVATFAGVEQAQHIYGPAPKIADLKGKVVFLEYWGINCPPCRASFPHLVEKQKTFALTGKFTVLASHVQGYSDKVKEFLKEKGVNFPVVQQFRESAAPCGKGIPHAVLIDHTGKVVAKGSPTSLYGKIEELVNAAPGPVPPILGEVEIKRCKSEARRLTSGGAIKYILEKLDREAEGDDEEAVEAKALAAAARAYVEKRQDQLEAMAKETPGRALVEIDAFLKQVRGLECDDAVKALREKLREDRSARYLAQAIEDLQDLQEDLMKKGQSRSTQKKSEKLEKKLNKLVEDDDTSALVKAEAQALLQLL